MHETKDNKEALKALGYDLETGYVGWSYSLYIIPAELKDGVLRKEQHALVRMRDWKTIHLDYDFGEKLVYELVLAYGNYYIPYEKALNHLADRVFVEHHYRGVTGEDYRKFVRVDWASIQKWYGYTVEALIGKDA